MSVVPVVVPFVVLLLSVSGLAVPTQTVEEERAIDIAVAVAAFDGPLQPIEGTADLATTVAIGCDSPVDAGEGPVDIRAEVPDWAAVSVQPASVMLTFTAADCVAATSRTVAATVTVVLSGEAPAFGDIPVRVIASYRGASGAGTTNGTVAFMERVDARLEKTIHKVAPGAAVEIPLVVMNRGNGAILVDVQPVTGSGAGLDVAVPEPFQVEANSTETVPVTVRTKDGFGYSNERAKLLFDVSYVPVGEPERTPGNVTLTAVLQTQGLGGGAATFLVGGVLVLAAAGGVLALLLYRRKRPSS